MWCYPIEQNKKSNEYNYSFDGLHIKVTAQTIFLFAQNTKFINQIIVYNPKADIFAMNAI